MIIDINGTIFKNGPKPVREATVTVNTYEEFKEEFLKVDIEVRSIQRSSGFGGATEVRLLAPRTKHLQDLVTSWRCRIADEQFARGLQMSEELREIQKGNLNDTK